MRIKFVLLSLAAIASLGCGGGGAAPVGANTTNLKVGPLTAVYQAAGSNLKPAVVTNGSGPLVTGLAGANFSSIVADPTLSLAQTQIAFSSKGGLYEVHPDGTGLREISPNSGSTAGLSPAWYPSGLLVYYLDRIAAQNNALQIFRRYEDGTGPLQLTNITYTITSPTASTSKIAFSSNSGGTPQIYTANIDGSAIAQVSNNTGNDVYPLFSANGQTIYYEQLDGTLYNMYQMGVNGSNPTKLFSIGSTAVTDAVSPDGTVFAYQTGTSISIYPPNGLPFQATSPPSGSVDSSPSFSPDGKKLAFRRQTSTNGTLEVQNLDGSALAPLTDTSTNVNGVAWGPAVGTRTFVGSGGTMGASASGFLVSEMNTTLASFLTFACTTPGSATVTPASPGTSSTNTAFQLTGDKITSLKFTNDVFAPAVTVPIASTTKGAIVTFDQQTGQVSLVIPYTSAKARPGSDGLSYTGSFQGIWTAQGKNIAPSGATGLKIDKKTGRLLKV